MTEAAQVAKKERRRPPGLPQIVAVDDVEDVSKGQKLRENLMSVVSSENPVSTQFSNQPSETKAPELTRTASEQAAYEMLHGKSKKKKDPLEGIIIGLVDLERKGQVGKGSQGTVERALHRPTNKEVAVKVIPMDKMGIQSGGMQGGLTPHDQEKIRLLMIELETLKKCKSDYVVRFYGCAMDGQNLNFFIEWMDQGTLSDVLRRKKIIPEPYVNLIAADMVDGLYFLHNKVKVIHRDIKPCNVLLNSRGQVKLSDLGVSGQMQATMDYKQTWVGTMFYMSPERMKGGSYQAVCDVWSIGLTLMECSLGRFPYIPGKAVADKPKKTADAGKESEEDDDDCLGAQLGAGGYSFFDMLQRVQSPPPLQEFQEETQASASFVSFLDNCLKLDPSERTPAKKLRKHPWLETVAEGRKNGQLRDYLSAKGPGDEEDDEEEEEEEEEDMSD